MAKTLKEKSRFVIDAITGEAIHKNEAEFNTHVRKKKLGEDIITSALKEDTLAYDRLLAPYKGVKPTLQDVNREINELKKSSEPEHLIRLVFLKEIAKRIKEYANSKNHKIRGIGPGYDKRIKRS